MEPSFYLCKACNQTWQRMSYKLRKNPPAECPHCGAGEDQQGLDQVREDQYMEQVYKPMGDIIVRFINDIAEKKAER